MAAPMGERHPRAKIPDATVRRMRHMRDVLRYTYSRVAREIGCSIWTARDICDYRTRPL